MKFINFLERKLLTILVIVILSISCFFRINLLEIKNFESLLTNSITIVSIFVGILMSMLGFLLTVSGKAVIRNLKKLKAHKLLLYYFMLPIGSGVISVILAMVMIILPAENINLSMITSILWINLIFYFILAFIRVIILMFYILINVFEENDYEEENDNDRIEINEEIINQFQNEFDDPDEHI